MCKENFKLELFKLAVEHRGIEGGVVATYFKLERDWDRIEELKLEKSREAFQAERPGCDTCKFAAHTGGYTIGCNVNCKHFDADWRFNPVMLKETGVYEWIYVGKDCSISNETFVVRKYLDKIHFVGWRLRGKDETNITEPLKSLVEARKAVKTYLMGLRGVI